jgi:DNA-binding transcriptional LysR family regulator
MEDQIQGPLLPELKEILPEAYEARAVGIAEGAAAGPRIAALPVVIADSYVVTGTLVPIVSRYGLPEIGVFIGRSPGPQVSRKVRVLIDFLVARFRAAARSAAVTGSVAVNADGGDL